MLAVPNMGWIATGLVENIIYWMRDWKVMYYAPERFFPVAYARNLCVRYFLESDYDALWFVDSDTIPPKNALAKLMEVNQPVVSGAVPTIKGFTDKGFDVFTVLVKEAPGEDGYKTVFPDSGHMRKVDACGAACLLIQREVLRAIPSPWFEMKLGKDGIVECGEDFRFCEKVREAGFEITGRYDVVCRHVKEAML